MRDLPKQDRERARVLVEKPMQNEILLDPVHLAHVNKTEIEFNTDFAFDVSCSNLVERFECKRSTETEKYTKADVDLLTTLIRELIDERPPNGDRRITALLQLLTRSRSKKIPSSNEAVERQRTIATVRVHDLRHGLCSLRLQAGESLHGNFLVPGHAASASQTRRKFNRTKLRNVLERITSIWHAQVSPCVPDELPEKPSIRVPGPRKPA